MALKSLSDILLALVPFLFLFLQSQSQSAPAPAPTPKSSSSPVNLTGILEKNGQFTIFIRLIIQTQVANQIVNQNNSSNEGMTIFAPTDNAFNNLKAGALNSLSYNQQVQLILYHVLPNYYTMISLLTVPNPVRTQATGQDGKPYGLNFIGKQNQVHVSTGVVQTQINNALRQQFPLALYPLDKVLLPEELFGENSPPTSSPGPTKTPMDKESPKNNAADGPSSASENQTGDSSNKNIGFAFVTGLCFIVFLGFIVN